RESKTPLTFQEAASRYAGTLKVKEPHDKRQKGEEPPSDQQGEKPTDGPAEKPKVGVVTSSFDTVNKRATEMLKATERFEKSLGGQALDDDARAEVKKTIEAAIAKLKAMRQSLSSEGASLDEAPHDES